MAKNLRDQKDEIEIPALTGLDDDLNIVVRIGPELFPPPIGQGSLDSFLNIATELLREAVQEAVERDGFPPGVIHVSIRQGVRSELP